MSSDDPRHPSPDHGSVPPEPEPSPPPSSMLDEQASALVDARRGEPGDAITARGGSGDAPGPLGSPVEHGPAEVGGVPDEPPPGGAQAGPPEGAPVPDPEVAARAAAMESARAGLRAVPPASPDARERALAAALAAFDDEAVLTSAPPAGTAPPSRSTDLDHHRSRRGAGRWIGAAAAAVLVIGVLVAGIAGQPSSDDAESADEATASMDVGEPETGEAGSAAEGDAEAAPGADDGARVPEATADAPATAGRSLVAIGDFPSVDDLLDSAAGLSAADLSLPDADATASEQATDGEGGGDPRCAAAAVADGATAVILVATGSVAGSDAEVWRVTGSDGERLVAFDAGCSITGSRPVP
jgi:hypothetical protein